MQNQPKKYVENKAAETLRAAIENQGKWIYFLTVEGLERGLDAKFAREAMRELGAYYADSAFKDCETVEMIGERLMNASMERGREAEMRIDDREVEIQIGYCPMLNLWNQLTEDADRKRTLCEISCELYRGLAERKGFDFERSESIASGCERCVLCFRKRDQGLETQT